MNFCTKAEYLVAVKTWKSDYLNLIVEIRKSKIAFKNTQRAFSKCVPYLYTAKASQTDEQKANNAGYIVAESSMTDSFGAKYQLRVKATEMLLERAASKIEAQRQYLAANEVQHAA